VGPDLKLVAHASHGMPVAVARCNGCYKLRLSVNVELLCASRQHKRGMNMLAVLACAPLLGSAQHGWWFERACCSATKHSLMWLVVIMWLAVIRPCRSSRVCQPRHVLKCVGEM
jgi:hypothetical protein